MEVPDSFVDCVQDKVLEFKQKFGLGSERHAFASWVIGYLNSIDDDEAIEITDTLDSGDGGLDGAYYDSQEKIFYVYQVKYQNNPKTGKSEGIKIFDQVYNAYKLLNNKTAAFAVNQKIGKICEKFLKLKAVGEIKVVLCGIVFGQINSTAIEKFRSRCESEGLIPEYFDLEKLYDFHISQTTIQDLSGQEVPIPINEATCFNYSSQSKVAGIGKAFVVNINAKDFVKSTIKYKRLIFSSNVRYRLQKKNKVNTDILQTLETIPHNFWYYNNGITITCNKSKLNSKKTILTLENPQIVNGGQTVSILMDLEDEVNPGVYLLCRIIEVDKTIESKDLGLEIAKKTNSQSPVKVFDFYANDPIQKAIQTSFFDLKPKWHYERKRGEWETLKKGEKGRFKDRRIKMVDLAQHWASFEGYPAQAISNKERLFDDQTIYQKIFKKNRNAEEYLLVKKLYDLFNEYLNLKNLQEIQKIVQGSFPKETLEKLLKSRALVIAHSLAISKFLIEKHYGKIDYKKSVKLISILDRNEQNFRNALLRLVFINMKMVSDDKETSVFKTFLRNPKTYKKLTDKIEENLAYNPLDTIFKPKI
jgi:hypothetical protein